MPSIEHLSKPTCWGNPGSFAKYAKCLRAGLDIADDLAALWINGLHWYAPQLPDTSDYLQTLEDIPGQRENLLWDEFQFAVRQVQLRQIAGRKP
jgi:hypothetical protein